MSDYIDEVYEEETTLLISRFNKPLAILKPYKKESNDYMRFFGFMADASNESGKEFVNRTRRSAKERLKMKRLRNRNA